MGMKAGIPIMETAPKKEWEKQFTRYQSYVQKLFQRMKKADGGAVDDAVKL